MVFEHVLLFSNPYSGGSTSSTIIKNITSLSSQLAYSERIVENITTLSANYAQTTDGVIQGLLYVPDLHSGDLCNAFLDEYIPSNATRQANLPPTSYNLIAVAPWVSRTCTKRLLDAARSDPVRGFIFYLPDTGATPPPPASDPVWDLGDDGKWKTEHKHPIYAISGASGAEMMRQLSFYSGNLTTIPYGADITSIYDADPDDYVRVWTELRVSSPSTLALWMYVLIIVALLLFVVGTTSTAMHCVQNRRRASLRRRVMRGEIDLEALGIKRVTVPMEHIQRFPLFTYNYDPPLPPSNVPTSPQSPQDSIWKASDTVSRATQAADLSANYQPLCHICVEDFESKATIIRELPCGHIFHPDCVDEFLNEISSLCPICSKSMLPRGYCPRITNGMVRREKATRKLRPVVVDRDLEGPRPKIQSWSSGAKKRTRSTPSSPVPPADSIELPERLRVVSENNIQDNGASRQQRMRELAAPMNDGNSDDG
ncbi:uncharacterized protein BCR38DRAFT_490186 [Pseudomassariella vexata]|uniref:RING-type domain-containing protein n=1 Tax=Pseudomassariella vexata TaxID=1141098 RepID=A0A1Y2DD54_9PEZI|nr:uncharacterized protein BCR38DRAFT_490186 [Pseudomassariella vexata]ORY57212.1 hypothetical protein BCR38DRAFT_490186 [Pseudomassariella vexata]